MSRPMQPRTVVVKVLRSINTNGRNIARRWANATRTWDQELRIGRPARPDELPENQTEEWAYLRAYAAQIRDEADWLVRYAEQQAGDAALRTARRNQENR